jgi:hypothetical protein
MNGPTPHILKLKPLDLSPLSLKQSLRLLDAAYAVDEAVFGHPAGEAWAEALQQACKHQVRIRLSDGLPEILDALLQNWTALDAGKHRALPLRADLLNLRGVLSHA